MTHHFNSRSSRETDPLIKRTAYVILRYLLRTVKIIPNNPYYYGEIYMTTCNRRNPVASDSTTFQLSAPPGTIPVPLEAPRNMAGPIATLAAYLEAEARREAEGR